MELKCSINGSGRTTIVVLIVPLWNWNVDGSCGNKASFCFNRTFMELKYSSKKMAWSLQGSFNRTFMELKYVSAFGWSSQSSVLIVPLWNWNFHLASKNPALGCFNRTFMELKWSKLSRFGRRTKVLIVPLWNWNATFRPHYHGIILF